jgi:hypothetical protein
LRILQPSKNQTRNVTATNSTEPQRSAPVEYSLIPDWMTSWQLWAGVGTTAVIGYQCAKRKKGTPVGTPQATDTVPEASNKLLRSKRTNQAAVNGGFLPKLGPGGQVRSPEDHRATHGPPTRARSSGTLPSIRTRRPHQRAIKGGNALLSDDDFFDSDDDDTGAKNIIERVA